MHFSPAVRELHRLACVAALERVEALLACEVGTTEERMTRAAEMTFWNNTAVCHQNMIYSIVAAQIEEEAPTLQIEREAARGND